ncbi:MAG TPA: hypothetical protein VK985_00445 [Rariglobus sp.]|nr:hypothetical protein [Rariglobus sp.]
MRESALGLAKEKLKEAQDEVVAEKARLEEKPGLLKNLTPKAKQEREQSIKTAQNNLLHYDLQLKKAESLTTLIHKDIRRWLECCLKTASPDYAAALATHDYPEDWSRFSYSFELLIKSFHMGLQDLMAVFRRENDNGPRSQLLMDSIRKLLPIARQIEIDVEFFNRILVQQGKLKRAAGKVAQHPEYSWCETVDQLGVLPLGDALETLRELLSASTGFLANLSQAIKREQFLVEAKAAQFGKTAGAGQSFLQTWQEGLRSASLQQVNVDKLGAIITETESLLMDGEFTARFNRHMVQSITTAPAPSAPEKPATTNTTPAFPQNDSELRALKAKLQAELEEVAKTKAGLAARERTLKENEQKLRDHEHAFAEKCKREQAVLDEVKAKLVEMEESISIKDREAEEKRAEQMTQLEEKAAELAARSVFMDESELRLLEKGQEQLERLADMEQREEDLMTTKRELNAMRKEMGLPMIALRAKPVDEFEE